MSPTTASPITDSPTTVGTATAADHVEGSADVPVGRPVDVQDVIVEDLLVEEVSIDGMCGIY